MLHELGLPRLAQIVEVAEGAFHLHLAPNRQAFQVLAHLASVGKPGVLILPVHLQAE